MSKKENRYRDWEFAREALRKVLRVWSLEFSSLELRTALFVYDRTLGWGKEWEVITTEQASDGVWSEAGECYAAPITKDKARARAALKKLVDKGFLYRRAKDKTYEYSLNLDDMKVPKRLKEGVRNRISEGCEIALFTGAKSHSKEYIKRREAKYNMCASASHSASLAADGIEEARNSVERIMVRSKARAEAKKKSGKFERCANGSQSGFVPFKNVLPIIWVDMHKKYFPEASRSAIPAVTLKILHSYAKNWTHLRTSGEFLEYLEWVFANWQTLKAGPFSWMSAFPIAPSARIIVNSKLRVLMEEAFQHREWWSQWSKMDEYERKVEHLVAHKGMDRDKAESIAKKEIGLKDEVRRLKDERHKLELAASRVKQAYSQERAALRKQQQRSQSRLLDVEGDFGKWDSDEN